MINITELLVGSLKESLDIIAIIFVLMVVLELLVLKYKHKILKFTSKNAFLSYIVSALFGSIPGCVGTFAMDSLYMAGMLGFGGIIAAMVATSGDEAIMMISMIATGKLELIPIVTLFGILFILGIAGGFLADFIMKKMKFKFNKHCEIKNHKHEEFKLKHFLTSHVWNHIIKKHIWQIFIWLFIAIFAIGLIKPLINTDVIFSGANLIYILLIASFAGLLPISGPNIFLIVMFANGLIPFSILLANSIIQDGHGLLPIIGYSIKDAVKIKIFNFIFGLVIGAILLSIGL